MEHEVQLRSARTDEAEFLSALALRSKSHWGYSVEFLEAVRAELAMTEADCASGSVIVAELDGHVVGFYALTGSPPFGELDSLFVDLGVIGTGIGRLLLDDALREAAARGFTSLTLDADPGAESFYLRHGAIRIGESPSGSIPGRLLPQMRFDLDQGLEK